MDLLRSSILGKDFIKYRKYTSESERRRFYRDSIANNKIPVVVDSVDETFVNIFRKKFYVNDVRIVTYGVELKFDREAKLKDVMKEIKIELIKANKENLFIENDIRIGCENGDIISEENESLYKLYKNYRNVNDNILYLLVTKEQTMYNYIMSIIRSLWGLLYKN